MLSDNFPKISVILPAYNAEKYIEAAVNSILLQTYQNFEIFIADDCSNDRTKAIIDAMNDSRIQTYHNETNLGKTETVKKLYSYVSGTFVTIHDADDISLPERFEKQMLAFATNPKLGMCGTSFNSVSEDGKTVLETIIMESDYNKVLENIPNASQFHGPTMMIKKSILDELGEIYRPFFKNNYEDTDLAYRIAERYESVNLPEVLYIYRILETSLCRSKVDVWNRNLYKAVAFLAKERKESGADSIMRGNPQVVYDYFNTATIHYQQDTSLIHREAAAYFMYWKLYPRAIKEGWLSVVKNPFSLVNWRIWFYCYRKRMFSKK
jgi:glycosyltransferase involved in cell wall biosynthesis